MGKKSTNEREMRNTVDEETKYKIYRYIYIRKCILGWWLPAGQCKMAAALVAAVDGAAGPGTVGASAGRRMTLDGKQAAGPRQLPCL